MRHTSPRKSTPKVKTGQVRKKNKRGLRPGYYEAPLPRMILIDRRRPYKGYKHVLSTSDIHRFLELLPDWNTLAVGLNAIVLAPGSDRFYGTYNHAGVIRLHAWDENLCLENMPSHVEKHQA